MCAAPAAEWSPSTAPVAITVLAGSDRIATSIAASQNLFELIQGHGIIAYPDSAMRLAISRAVAIETPRGFAMTSVGTTWRRPGILTVCRTPS